MSAVPARAAFPVLAILILAAVAGWYMLSRTPVAPPKGPLVSERPSPTAPGPSPAAAPSATGTQPPKVSADAPPGRPGSLATAQPPQNNISGQSSAEGQLPRAAAEGRPDERSRTEERVRPSFDVVRVEPTGDSVIAGRTAPGATIDLLRNGEALARAVADTSGLFAIVPPPLGPGTHEITLQSIEPDGTRVRSGQSVTVVIADRRDRPPLVTVTAPDQPTVVLSRPEDAKPGGQSPTAAPSGRTSTAAIDRDAGAQAQNQPQPSAPVSAARPPVRVAIVEAEGEGRLFVSGQAAPGATLRLYLNDAFVAPGGTGPDGRLSFTIERGIRPGDYRVRLDDVDPVTGVVKSRAEVPFNVPAQPPRAAAPLVASNAPPSPSGGLPGTAPPAAERRESPRPPVAAERPPGNPGPVASAPATPSAVAAPPRAGQAAPTSATEAPPAPSAEPQLSEVATPPAVATRQPATTARPETRPASPIAAGLPRPDPVARAGAAPSTAAYTSSTDPGQVIVPEVNTAIVARGDNLWRISKRVYGRGLRYTVIFDANTPQIRNPDLIYPGQVFVLPTGQ